MRSESLPLGAGRLTRQWLTHDPPPRRDVEALTDHLEAALAPIAHQIGRARPYELVVGTSKTFRSLARLAATARAGTGQRARHTLTDAGLRQLFSFISHMASPDLATLDGVSPGRAHQLVAGALVARVAMRTLEVGELQICPWALREGVILRRLTREPGTPRRPPEPDGPVRSAQVSPGISATGR